MPTIDRRTRYLGDAVALDASWLVDELPTALRDNGALAGRGVEVLGLPPLGFEVDDVTAHLTVADGRLVVRDGLPADGTVVSIDAAALSDLAQDVASTFGLSMAGRVAV